MATTVTLQPEGKKTVLELLEAQGFNVFFECRDGYCATCRIILLSGKVDYLSPPLISSNTEILSCCCYPLTEISVSI